MTVLKFEKRTYDAWLASAKLPYDSLIPLLHELEGSSGVYDALIHDAGNPLFHLIPEKHLERLSGNADDVHLSSFQFLLHKHKINSLTIEEEKYPHCLREIPDPPGILFYQGNPGCMGRNKTAAMIGSRNASYAGMRAARKIASELSRSGVTIVSGLALGIDAESHRGCLEGGSPTIAVMGCGLDRTYPAQNNELKNTVINQGGLILSEYAPGEIPLGFHFPYRNRIISGLSGIVILMEARIRSGSLTTVGHALKQGKEVYAYPGDPISPMSEGNRLLLREGAHYFTEAREILEDMNWLDNLPYIMQNSECSAKTVPENACERSVFQALEKGELGFDELQQITGATPQELMSTLTVLQIRKIVTPLPGKKYRLRS